MASPTYTTLGPAMPDPMPGQPVDLPIRQDNGNAPPRIKVHTELGVPIYFDPSSAQFSAKVGDATKGKGANSELHSADFAVLVERIRKRALVVPVEGYLVSVNHRAQEGEELILVRPCTVIEHHPKRYQPFVVRVVEFGNPRRWDRTDGPPPMVERIRSSNQVLLPEPEHIERVRAAQKALLAEEQRHERARAQLQQAVRDALEAIPQLTARDLKYVQESGRQVAQPPEEVGALVYDVTDDEEEDDE